MAGVCECERNLELRALELRGHRPFVCYGPCRSLWPPGYALAQRRHLFLAALCGWMRSLAHCAGVSVAAGRVGAGVFVVVVVNLVAGSAAVGWAVRGPGCVCSFRRAGIIGGHTFEELGRLGTVVGGAPA